MPVEERGLSSRPTQDAVRDLEIGRPSNSEAFRHCRRRYTRKRVKSCPRAGCGKSACPVVCPVKAGMFSREQTCRGRSQSPVVWIAVEMETEPSKTIDKICTGKITTHRAITTVNALWPRN